MIPKIIHQIWIQGENQLPEKHKEFIKTWKDFHKEYEYILWDDMKLYFLIKNNYPQYLKYYIESNYTNKSNLGRYFIFHKYGGIYADTDSYVLKPLDDLLNTGHDIILSKGDKIPVINAGISLSKPNLSFWFELIKFSLHRPHYVPNYPIEPFGVLSLSYFMEEKKDENILVLPPVSFHNKNLDDENQYVVHVLEKSWRAELDY